MDYHFSQKVKLPYVEALYNTVETLKKEGFGIITSIDMREVLKKKLGVNFRNYTILGACNPRYSYEALLEEDKMGVFLPCNVVVQEHEDGEVEVSVVNPEALTQHVDDLTLKSFATDIKSSLLHALHQI